MDPGANQADSVALGKWDPVHALERLEEPLEHSCPQQPWQAGSSGAPSVCVAKSHCAVRAANLVCTALCSSY